MTIAERLHAAGWQKGRQEGKQEGWQQGRQEEALRIARTMLESGLERDYVLRVTGISSQELATIDF